MNRTRSALLTLVSTVLLLLDAGPALAGPAPLDSPPAGGGGSQTSSAGSSGFDPSTWAVVGYAAAGLVVALAVLVAVSTIVRHSHAHTPRPV